MSNTQEPWTKYFLVYWVIATIVLCLSWIMFREHFLSVMGLYMATTFAAMLIVVFREQRNLMRYLKRSHIKKWEEVTTFPLFGGSSPGGRNSFRVLGFVYGDDDLNDPMIKCLKHNFRKISPWTLIVPIAHVGLIFFLVFVGVLHRV